MKVPGKISNATSVVGGQLTESHGDSPVAGSRAISALWVSRLITGYRLTCLLGPCVGVAALNSRATTSAGGSADAPTFWPRNCDDSPVPFFPGVVPSSSDLPQEGRTIGEIHPSFL